MEQRRNKMQYAIVLFLTFLVLLQPLAIRAASCKTQAQMTSEQRDALSSTARTIVDEVQRGDVKTIQANTIPAVATNFSGITSLMDSLKPQLQQASITVDDLYMLDAPTDSLGAERTDFYCGTPVVALNFTHLPPGSYALVILHATGVPHPQQISLILSETTPHHWMLGGFFSKPLVEAGHDGLWYWASAREYAQRRMMWNAWLYYRTAVYLVDPVDFLSSPNMEKLQHEEDLAHPEGFPGTRPLLLSADGSVFQVTAIDTTTTFGPLDIEVHYAPDAVQTNQLQNLSVARKQVTDVMTAMLTLHPELLQAFHGIWVQADGQFTSLFSLELPMNQIVPATQPLATSLNPAIR